MSLHRVLRCCPSPDCTAKLQHKPSRSDSKALHLEMNSERRKPDTMEIRMILVCVKVRDYIKPTGVH